jgi:hypothetical protein
MLIARLKTEVPVNEHGYFPTHYFGRGNLPVVRFVGERPNVGDIVMLDFVNDERLRVAPPTKLPGEVEPRFGTRRTVIRIRRSNHTTTDRDLYIVVADGKHTTRSNKYRYNYPPLNALNVHTFQAKSATGNHWTDVLIYTVPAEEDGAICEDRN